MKKQWLKWRETLEIITKWSREDGSNMIRNCSKRGQKIDILSQNGKKRFQSWL